MKVIYRGPAHEFNGVRPAKGAEFDLEEAQLKQLISRGHRFALPKNEGTLPDPAPPVPLTPDLAALLAGETPAAQPDASTDAAPTSEETPAAS